MNPIPNPITVNTGEQHTITKTIDDFFIETKNHVSRKYKKFDLIEFEFQVKSGELAYNQFTITNDRITYLSYMDIVLASVFETRTQSNYVHYTFFRDLKGVDFAMENWFR